MLVLRSRELPLEVLILQRSYNLSKNIYAHTNIYTHIGTHARARARARTHTLPTVARQSMAPVKRAGLTGAARLSARSVRKRLKMLLFLLTSNVYRLDSVIMKQRETDCLGGLVGDDALVTIGFWEACCDWSVQGWSPICLGYGGIAGLGWSTISSKQSSLARGGSVTSYSLQSFSQCEDKDLHQHAAKSGSLTFIVDSGT